MGKNREETAVKQTNVQREKKSFTILIYNCLKIRYPEQWKHVQTKACSGTFTAALVIMAKKRKQLKWPSTHGWINKMRSSHTTEYHYHNKDWALIMNYNVDGPWRQRSAKWKKRGIRIMWFYLYEMSRRVKAICKANRLMLSRSWGWRIGGKWELTANGCRVSSGDDENVLKWTVVRQLHNSVNTVKSTDCTFFKEKNVSCTVLNAACFPSPD